MPSSTLLAMLSLAAAMLYKAAQAGHAGSALTSEHFVCGVKVVRLHGVRLRVWRRTNDQGEAKLWQSFGCKRSYETLP